MGRVLGMDDLQKKANEACARAAHEANKAYCDALGLESHPGWDSAPEWQKESARQGVALALGGATPATQHQAWWDAKKEAGWVYGPVKDPEKKEHPCMVPYTDLPAEQQAKDHLYQDIVKAMARAIMGSI